MKTTRISNESGVIDKTTLYFREGNRKKSNKRKCRNMSIRSAHGYFHANFSNLINRLEENHWFLNVCVVLVQLN